MINRLFSPILLLSLLISNNAAAVPFGVFDARSIAMGGAGVASSRGEAAAYFNPALLAQYNKRKEKARNSSFVFPLIGGRVTTLTDDLDDFDDRDLDTQLENAVDAYNANKSTENMQAVLNASTDLQTSIGDISDNPRFVSAAVGLIVGIPSKGEGGAFIMTRRAIGDAKVVFTDNDEQILDDYINTMQFLASNGAEGEQRDTVIDANGDLIPRVDDLTSAGRARGAIISELAVAMSHKVNWFDTELLVGITPKFVNVITHDAQVLATDNESQSEETTNHDWDFNLDLGVVKFLNPFFRVGVVVKDVVPRDYKTALGNRVRIRPQVRFGAAVDTDWGLYAADLDVLENEATIGNDLSTQQLALGGEWGVSILKLRLGYSYDLKAEGEARSGLISGGLSISGYGMALELAYAENNVETAGGLQFAYYF